MRLFDRSCHHFYYFTTVFPCKPLSLQQVLLVQVASFLYFVASPNSKQFHSGGTWSFRIALQYFLEGANNNNIKRSPLHMFHFVQLQPLLVKCIIQRATTHILVNTCMHMLPQTLTHHAS